VIFLLPADLQLPPGTDLARITPRVCHYPRYAFSSGAECIEIAASAGLHLDPWQQLCLQLGLGETDAGRWASFIVALIVSRQNGKGSILEALELFWLFGTGEALIGHSAHEYRTAMEAFRRVVGLITDTDWMRKKVKKVINTNGEEGVELLTGQRLRFLARSKGSGRGFTFRKLVWDEAYALTREQQEAQLPTLSAVPNPQIWLTSSPPLSPDTGEVMFQLREQALAGAAGLTFLDYGLAGSLDRLDGIDLDDQDAWHRANPSAPHRITLETMRRERLAMSDAGFARERLGIWPPSLGAGFSVIGKEQWEALQDGASGSDLTGRPVLSFDVTPRQVGPVTASISLAQRRTSGPIHLELIKNGPGSSWVVPDLVTLVRRTDPCAIVVDPGGPAGSLVPELEAALAAEYRPDLLVKMTTRDVASAFGMIYDAATSDLSEGRTVTHLGQSEYATALAGAGKRAIGDGHAWDRRTAATDITPLVAATAALWGLAKLGAELDAMPMVAWA
jgi:hypothetical protein